MEIHLRTYNPLGWNLDFVYPSLQKIIRSISTNKKQGWKTVGESFLPELESPSDLETSMLVNVGPFCYHFGKNWIWKKHPFVTGSTPSPSGKILEMTMRSFHGFGKNRFDHGIYLSNLSCSVFSCFSFLLLKVGSLPLGNPIGTKLGEPTGRAGGTCGGRTRHRFLKKQCKNHWVDLVWEQSSPRSEFGK